MRRAVLTVAGAVLLSGATVLAFFSGGYYAEPRLIAAIVGLGARPGADPGRGVAAPADPARAARARRARAADALERAVGDAGRRCGGPAIEAVERLVLYAGALLLAVGVLRTRAALRAVEPALAAGATIVIGYGLAGRLLPGIVHLDRSRSAGGRLEQPITYWNAEGALAAVGLVLCARLAADRTRPLARADRGRRGDGAARGRRLPLLFARRGRRRRAGARAARRAGADVRASCAPPRWRSLAGAAAAATAAALPGVASLEGSEPQRDGAIALVVLALLAGGAALVAARSAPAPDRPLPQPRRLRLAAAVAAAAVAVGLVAAGLGERPTAAELAAGAQAGRLTTASSNRYEYWRVGLDAFRREPLTRPRRRPGSASNGCASARSPKPCGTRTRSRSRSPRSWACSDWSPSR